MQFSQKTKMLLLSAHPLFCPRGPEPVRKLTSTRWWIVGRSMQWVFIFSSYFTLWHASMSSGKMSPGTCQIFIKLITVSPQTGSDKPRIRTRDLRHSSLTVWHQKGDHPRLHRVHVFILFCLSCDLWDLRVLVTRIFTLMFLICIMLDPSRVETRVKVARSL